MYVVAIAWLYVVVLMALAEGVSDHGSWLGAGVTFMFYGVLPLGIVLYLIGTTSRREARQAQQAQQAASATSGVESDGGGHAAGDAIAPERKEP